MAPSSGDLAKRAAAMVKRLKRQKSQKNWRNRRFVMLGGGVLAIALSLLVFSQQSVRLSLKTLLRQPVSVAVVQQATEALGTSVYLEGRVGDRVPLVNALVYQLEDGTGAIWVVTQNTNLQPGEAVRILGEIRFESIPLAGQELGEIYLEEERRERGEL